MFAKLAEMAYDAYKSPSSINQMHVGSYQSVPQLSDRDSVLFVNRNKKELVLATRGTVPTNPEDLALDAAIIANKLEYTPRFQRLIQKASDIIEALDMLKSQVIHKPHGAQFGRFIIYCKNEGF